MSATTTICQYDAFARIINESWGPDVSELVFTEIDAIGAGGEGRSYRLT
jgi:hypothetical protein